ncbi:MAG: hypothetical protein KGJ79_12810 [Alphaproteobacteria bacterium]|nr:hypothetical protein [Alphaproteobacteria bacterium]MDE2112017.1 hypothetical protein [Alphaproteobacteria bacterium]
MLKIAAITALSIFALMPGRGDAAVRSDCPIENSAYSLRLDPTIVARFVKISKVPGLPSDLAFEVTWHKDDTTFWYTFDKGTAVYINMVSISDPTAPGYIPPVQDTVKRPHGDMQYLALQGDLSFDDSLPKSGMKAPKLILMPRFPEIQLRQSPSAHSFFELSSCSK